MGNIEFIFLIWSKTGNLVCYYDFLGEIINRWTDKFYENSDYRYQ